MVELLYLALMLRWEKSAPRDGHQGLLDGRLERNTQKSRLVYVLGKIAAGNDRFLPALSQRTRRNDGNSYVANDSAWMTDPCSLADGWYVEGCMSLPQKQDVVSAVVRLGHSPLFGACVNDFIAGKSVRRYMPSIEQQEELVRELIAAEAISQAVAQDY